MKHAFLIAAASSGSGKTTITLGILHALREMGLSVRPFKCGPDFIDTQYHATACGVPSVNLDTWMSSAESVGDTFRHYATDCDVAVCEGVMGLYDGADGMRGSSAEVAELLGLPVILVLDARSMAFSAAPLLHGYRTFRPETRIAGVIFNKVGSERHYRLLHQAAEAAGVPCLGYLPRRKDLYSPSRHLGLDLSEMHRIEALASEVSAQLSEHVDMEQLLRLSSCSPSSSASPLPFCSQGQCREVVYVARDAAFNFLYQESLDRLAALGTVRFFSPLANEPVGADATLVYIPGGYPEFFLPQLSQSHVTQQSLRLTKARIIAECGGMMYLSQSIDNYAMTGLLPFSTTMQDAHLHLGYRTYEYQGTTLTGHEFHYSDYMPPVPQSPVFHGRNIWASYIHWSPLSLLQIAGQHFNLYNN